MASQILPFNFEKFQIRVVESDGDPLFVAKDVMLALGYDVSNVPDRIKHIPDEWKGRAPVATPGGTQEMAVLSKHGLLHFLSRSDKPRAAKMVEAWISTATDISNILKALNDFEIPEDLPELYVYAIQEQDSKNVKLGISKDPERRLKELQACNSSKLELIAYRKAENRFRDEAALHIAANLERIRGEWFTERALALVSM